MFFFNVFILNCSITSTSWVPTQHRSHDKRKALQKGLQLISEDRTRSLLAQAVEDLTYWTHRTHRTHLTRVTHLDPP